MLKVTRNHVYPDFWKPTAWTWANCFILPQKNWKTHNFTWGTESSQHCDRLFNEVKWPGLWNLDIIGANAGEAGAERSAGKGLFGYLQTDWFTSKFTMKHLLIIAAFIPVLLFPFFGGSRCLLATIIAFDMRSLFSINLWSVNCIMLLIDHLKQTSRAVVARNNN